MASSKRELLITLGADTTTFSQKVKRAKDLTKELDSEFKLASSSSKNFENSVDGLAKKQDYLSNKIKVTTSLSKVYLDRMKETQDALKNVTRSQEEYTRELEKMNQDLGKLQKGTQEYKQLEDNIKKVAEQQQKATKETKTYNDRMILLNKSYNESQTELQKLNKELTETGTKLSTVGRDTKFKEMSRDIEESSRKFENLKNSTNGFGKSMGELVISQKHYSTQIEKTNRLMDEYSKDMKQSEQSVDNMKLGIDALNREVKEHERLVASMNANDPDYDIWSNELENYRAELTIANTIVAQHKQRIETLTTSYNGAEMELAQLKGALNSVETELRTFGRATKFEVIEKSIESVRHEFELLDSKMELLRSKFLNFENSLFGAVKETKLLKEQTQALRNEYSLQKQALDGYQNELNQLSQKHDKLTNKIKELKISLASIDRESPKFNETIVAIGQLERELDDVDRDIDQVTNSLRAMEIASNGTLTNINNNIQAQGRTWDVLSNNIRRAGDGFISVGNSMRAASGALMPLTMGVGILGAGIVKVGMDFEAQISRLGALSGETGAKLKTTMKELETGAKDLGRTTQYSATEASKGLEDFMLAGYNATDAIKAMPIAVQMATADNIALNDATELLVTALSSLGENSELTGNQVQDLGILANQMAVNAVATTTDMAGLARSFVKVGGQAENLHMPLSTTGTLLGILGDKGVVAEEAGNSLNSILINLTQTTGQSADAMKALGVDAFDPLTHKMKPVPQILAEIKKKLESFDGDEQEVILKNMLGGKTQAKTLMKLLQGIDSQTGDFTEKYKKLKEELENAPNTNALGEMYNKSKDNLKGDLFTLKSTVEDSFLTIYKSVQEPLREIVQKTTEAVRTMTEKWRELPAGVQEFILKLVLLSATIAPLLGLFGLMVSGIGHSVKAFGGLVGGIGKVVTKFALLKENGFKLASMFPKLTGAMSGASGASGGLAGALGGLSGLAIPLLIAALAGIGAALGENENALSWLVEKWGWFGEAVAGILEKLNGIVRLFFGNFLTGAQTLGRIVVAAVTGNFKDIDNIIKEGCAKIQSNTGKAVSNLSSESTKAIKQLRKITSDELGQVENVFKRTFDTLPTLTTSNMKQVANSFTDTFKSAKGDTVALSQSTLEILRGTSDTMSVLFTGIKDNMNIQDARTTFENNMQTLLLTGKTSTEELSRDFEKAGKLIDQNLVDGIGRMTKNADSVLKEFNAISKGDIQGGVDNIVSTLGTLDSRGIETLRGVGTNWNSIFAGIKVDGSQNSQQMTDQILANLDRLGLDTPQKLKAFQDNLKNELDVAKQKSSEKGLEIGETIPKNIENGVNSAKDAAINASTETGTQVGEGTKKGLEQGMAGTASAVEKEMQNVNQSVNAEGEKVTSDMTQKGADAGRAYVSTMESELPKLSSVSQKIKGQLDGIDKVRLGNVTKQLSEVNRWLGIVQQKAVPTRQALVNLTNLPFGNTTKGLSEVNKWLGTVKVGATNCRQPMLNLTNLPFGNTTKGLSEVSRWLGTVRNNANSAASALRNISSVGFGGVTKGLSQVASWLDTVKRKAGATKSAVQSASSAKPRSVAASAQPKTAAASPRAAMPRVRMFTMESKAAPPPPSPTAFSTIVAKSTNGGKSSNWMDFGDISKYKTSGGYYAPKSMTKESKQEDSKEVLSALLQQNQLLMQLLSTDKNINVGVQVDGRQIAKASAKYIQQELNSTSRLDDRMRGKINYGL